MTVRHLSMIGLASCLISASAVAQQSGSARDRQVAPQAIAVDPASTVPVDSVAEDLQKIVVLCATEPSSDEFETEWASYIEKHPVTAENLDALIEDVLERAAVYRAEQSSNSRTNLTLTIMTTTQKMMHDTAMAVIRKIG